MTPAKKWYQKLTVESVSKFLGLCTTIAVMVVGVLSVTAAPYIKSEIDKAIQLNNQWLEQQYAGKNELLIKIYESQKATNEQIVDLKEDVATIKGKLSK